MKKIIIGLACALMLVASPTLAKPKKKDKNAGRITVESFKQKTASVSLGTTVVKGRIYKPSVFFIVSRASVRGALAPRYHFRGYIGRILNDALKRPF